MPRERAVGPISFFRQFLRDPTQIGAVAPSSRALARRMVDAAGIEAHHVVVELGPGTGPMTREILAQGPTAGFVALEPNAALAERWRRRFPGLTLDGRGAEGLVDVLAELSLGRAHRVVSSLPFAIWPIERQTRVLDAVVAAMQADGRFVTFGYLQSQLLPAAAHLRATLRERFHQVRGQGISWWNLPPAVVWACDGPR